MGESKNGYFRVGFNQKLKIGFKGAQVTSNGGFQLINNPILKMSHLYTLLLLWYLCGCVTLQSAEKEGGAFIHPGGMHTIAQIQTARQNREKEPWELAYHQLIQEATKGLTENSSAVQVFSVPAYYHHPVQNMSTKKGLSDNASTAYALALAYQLDSSDKRIQYAEKAVDLLNAWARINKRVSGADGDLVICYTGIPLIFAADLLSDYDGWSLQDQETFKQWVNQVFRKSADKIKMKSNNWGDWGIFASIAAAHLLDDQQGVLDDINLIKQRISKTIAPNGELPQENKRTNSGMWYTYFALTAMTGAAQVALNATGTNLFEYSAPNGRTIKTALDRFFLYCQNPYEWSYRKPVGLFGKIYNIFYPSANELKIPSPDDWPANLYEAMSAIYGEKKWENWLETHRPIRGGRGWIYPTLMRSLRAAPSSNGGVNVKDFGAIGNGLTNDTSAINSAIAALPATNGCLLFPPGNYLASGFSISGKTNLLILGEGATVTQSTPANNLFVVDNTCSKVTFHGLFLDGAATARLNGIHIRLAAPDSTVENCIFRKSSDFGLFITDDINTVTNVKVINCLFRETKGDGVHLGNVDGFVVADCIFYKTGDDSIAPLAGGAFLCQNGVISNNVIIGAGSRGIAVQYARNIKIIGNEIYGSNQSGIEVCDDGNSSVYNDYITVENNHLYGCTTSAGPLGNINIFFTKHGAIRGNEVYNPANGVCLAFADIQNTEISGNTFMQVTAQFCRGIMADGAKSHSSRKYAAIWDGVKIVNNVISMLSGSGNECIYLAPANSVIISNIIIAGNNCRNVPSGKYIYTDNLGTAAKIVNNTCLETRTIDNGGHGLSPTMANNN